MGQYLRLVVQFMNNFTRYRVNFRRKPTIFILFVATLFFYFLFWNKNRYSSRLPGPEVEYTDREWKKTTKLRTLKESIFEPNYTINHIASEKVASLYGLPTSSTPSKCMVRIVLSGLSLIKCFAHLEYTFLILLVKKGLIAHIYYYCSSKHGCYKFGWTRRFDFFTIIL